MEKLKEELEETRARRERKKSLKRDTLVGCKVNSLELNYIKTVAKIKGISVSEYLRKCAMHPSEFM